MSNRARNRQRKNNAKKRQKERDLLSGKVLPKTQKERAFIANARAQEIKKALDAGRRSAGLPLQTNNG